MAYDNTELPLWPLLPNWKRGVTESLEFRTRIIGPTLTGLRQKRRMRLAPRRSFGFEVHPHHQGRRLLDNLRFAQGKQEWALPVWFDRQTLAATLSSGATSIPCNTLGYDFVDGGLAVLRKNVLYSTQFEIVEIDTVGEDSITLATATDEEWPEGTFLYPIRRARMADSSNNAILLSGEVSTLGVQFDVSEPCDWEAYSFSSSYRNRPVWEIDTNWRQNRSFGFDRIITAVDNDTSIPAYFDFPEKTFTSLDSFLQAKTREVTARNRSLLYALAGRYTSIWVPTLANDLQMAANISSASTSLTVQYCGYSLFGLGKRQDIRIELVNGTVYYRRITNASVSGDNEVLTLSSALGANVSVAQVRRISFLMLMQQASDSATMTHLTDAASTLPVVFEGVIEPPA